MESRLKELEAALAELRRRLHQLEQRVPLQPGAQAAGAAREEDLAPAATPAVTGAQLMSGAGLTGRALLVLGGAFLIRALTEEGVLPGGAGAVVGLAFAAAWIGFAYRAGAASAMHSATAHGITAALIGYPLVLESATRLGAIPAAVAPLALGGFTAALLAVAWRLRLTLLAWIAIGSCLVVAIALLSRGAEDGALILLVVLVAVAAAWAAEHRRWRALHWPAALTLHVLVLRAVALSSRRVDPQGSVEEALGFALLVATLALGAMLHRTLWRRLALRPFEPLQVLVAFGVVLTGIVLTTAAGGTEQGVVGGLVLALAAGALFIGLGLLPRQADRELDSCFYSVLAVGLVFAGGALATTSAFRSIVWAAAAVAVAALGRSTHPRTLWSCAVVLLGGAAASSGLLSAASTALTAPPGGWAAVPVPAVVALALAGGAYLATVLPHPQGLGGAQPWSSRLAPAFLLLLVAVSVVGLAVGGVESLLAARGEDPAVLAAVRTVCLALAALLLAMGRRVLWRQELGWVACTLLAFGGVKLLVEDLRQGRAVTLLVGFAAFGAVLLVVSRLLRAAPLPPQPLAAAANLPKGGAVTGELAPIPPPAPPDEIPPAGPR